MKQGWNTEKRRKNDGRNVEKRRKPFSCGYIRGVWLRNVQEKWRQPCRGPQDPLSAIRRTKCQRTATHPPPQSPAYTLYNICIPYHPLAPLHSRPASMRCPQTPNLPAKLIQRPKRHGKMERAWSGPPSPPQISKRKTRTGVRNKTRGHIRAISHRFALYKQFARNPNLFRNPDRTTKTEGKERGGSLGSSTNLKTTVVGHSCEGAGERGRPGRLPVQGQQPARTSIPIKFLSRNAETEGKTKE